ncbi:MAG: glucose-1-phosphate cytidylyltransferase [Anaerolineae bacterium]|nr:glucose-1-phosphate cytidylyltransferase [Anaerolineae bacterium]
MKVVILAGGLGTRLAEETELKPKPMVEIGGQPIMWHIMMHYAHYDFKHFVIALGYKGEVIKKYMVDYCALNSNLTVNMATGETTVHDGEYKPDWIVDLVDTGAGTMTGGRVKRLKDHVKDGTFMLTYGDGVSNINLRKLLEFHKSHGKLVTLTAVRPVARFGHLELCEDHVADFTEKNQTHEGWINGGFFVVEPKALDYIDGDMTFWERDPLERLADDGQLMAYRHEEFWQCMDTLRDKLNLEKLWETGNPPWRIWS